MKTLLLFLSFFILTVSCNQSGKEIKMAGESASPGEMDRTVLPIKEPARPIYTELNAAKAKPPARFEVKAPKGAPNVIVILIDDIGFGASDAFGGPIHMPILDSLAASGLKYNRFHTTA